MHNTAVSGLLKQAAIVASFEAEHEKQAAPLVRAVGRGLTGVGKALRTSGGKSVMNARMLQNSAAGGGPGNQTMAWARKVGVGTRRLGVGQAFRNAGNRLERVQAPVWWQNGMNRLQRGAGNAVAGARQGVGNAVAGARQGVGNAVAGARQGAGNAVAGARQGAGNFAAGTRNTFAPATQGIAESSRRLWNTGALQGAGGGLAAGGLFGGTLYGAHRAQNG